MTPPLAAVAIVPLDAVFSVEILRNAAILAEGGDMANDTSREECVFDDLSPAERVELEETLVRVLDVMHSV